MNAAKLLKQGKKTLQSVNDRFGWQGDEDVQAWDILAHVLGRQPDEDESISKADEKEFNKLVRRRMTGEPLAYILGWVDFLDFRMTVKPGAFVPRLTSEFLAIQAIRRLRNRRRPIHVDLATGIGPVAIASARAVPKAKVFGFDISGKAVKQARENAAKLGVTNVTFMKSDMFSSMPKDLRGKVDVITIHPPYVPNGEIDDLPIEIKKYEPKHTLTDNSKDGLELSRRVIAEGREWLRPTGWLLIEIVAMEFKRIRPLMKDAGYTDIRSTHGELKLTRVICGRVPG
jgi:release factor glutamine methyltransferase